MKITNLSALALAVGLVFAADGLAQTAAPSAARGDTPKAGERDRTRATDRDRDDKNRATWAPDQGSFETSQLIGTRVRTADGKDIGEIEQLIVSTQDGKVSHAVIGLGGLAGIGERKVAVP